MRRLSIVFLLLALFAGSSWARETDEVIVTRQLTTSQRNSLPEKTIVVEMKRLTPAKKADQGLIAAITAVMDTIAQEDYMNRTFVLLIEPRPDGDIAISAHSDDIVTKGRTSDIMMGDIQHGRCHFVVLFSKTNQELLEQTFKRQGKVKFVQEFEFVDFKTPPYPTNVIGRWSPVNGLSLPTVIIDEDLNADRDAFDRPAHAED